MTQALSERNALNTDPLLMTGVKLRICKTAVDLFLSKGYQNTSINDIIKSPAVPASVYYYFESKDDIIETAYTYLENIFTEAQSAPDELQSITPHARPAEISRTWFPLLADKPSYETARKILSLAVREYKYDERAAKIVSRIYNTISQRVIQSLKSMIASGTTKPLDVKTFALVYSSTVIMSAVWPDGSHPFLSPAAERQRNFLITSLQKD